MKITRIITLILFFILITGCGETAPYTFKVTSIGDIKTFTEVQGTLVFNYDSTDPVDLTLNCYDSTNEIIDSKPLHYSSVIKGQEYNVQESLYTQYSTISYCKVE